MGLDDSEEKRIGERLPSKSNTPQGAESSNLSSSAKKDRRIINSVFDTSGSSVFVERRHENPQYKLALYRPNGSLRGEISSALVTELARQYGDLIRCVSSNRWMTMDDICAEVWAFEKKSHLKSFTRTRREIEDGVQRMVESDAIKIR